MHFNILNIINIINKSANIKLDIDIKKKQTQVDNKIKIDWPSLLYI